MSLGEAGKIPDAELNRLNRFGDDRFEEFLLLRHDAKMLHGPNRQAASEHVRHDLVMYQDADDLPHPQRISVVEHFFNNFDIMHLNHCCLTMAEPAPDYIWGKEPVKAYTSDLVFKATFPFGRLEDCATYQPFYGMCTGFHLTAGMPIVRRDVLKKVEWKRPRNFILGRSEDYEFNMETMFYFNKTLFINAKLIRYLHYEEIFRSFEEEDKKKKA